MDESLQQRALRLSTTLRDLASPENCEPSVAVKFYTEIADTLEGLAQEGVDSSPDSLGIDNIILGLLHGDSALVELLIRKGVFSRDEHAHEVLRQQAAFRRRNVELSVAIEEADGDED